MIGVAVMAYGTPASPGDVEAYYTHVRRGHPPSTEQLADLRRRYDAIGGVSPLRERTEAQAAAIQAALDERAPGAFHVALGMKHAAPYVEDAAAALAAGGADRIVGLVLAPHYSALSVGEYQERLRKAAATHGIPAVAVDHWHLLAPFVDFLAAAVRAARQSLGTPPDRTATVFTAHSLPSRILESADPYPGELHATAAAVAARAGLAAGTWRTAWQSAGRTPEPWLGPDVLTVIDELDGAGDVDGVVVCACGFVAEHLEVLYDLDVEAHARARAAGLAFARTPSVDDDPAVMAALAGLVIEVSADG